MRRLTISLLVATISVLCVNEPRIVSAQVSQPILATATKAARLCVNPKTRTITPRTSCTRAERTFTANSYLQEIKKVSNKLNSLTTTVEAFPQPNLLLVVAPSGALIKTVQDAIAVANAASLNASTPALIKLAPGTYTLPSGGITVPSHVALEGSGIGTTILQLSGTSGVLLGDAARVGNLTIKASPTAPTTLIESSAGGGSAWAHDLELTAQGTISTTYGIVGLRVSAGTCRAERIRVRVGNSAGFAVGVLSAGSSAILRASNLDVESTGKQPQGLALYDNSDSNIVDSKITATSTATNDIGNAVRIDNVSTKVMIKNALITNITSTAGNEAVYLTEATDVTLDSCRIKATPGVVGSGLGMICVTSSGKLKIFNSYLETEATTPAISASGAGSSVRIANSTVAGGPVAQSSGGSVVCAGVTDENFTFAPATCPN